MRVPIALLFAPILVAQTHSNVAGRDVAIWKPAGPAPASGFPLILFSHGFTGCNTQSRFLMEALARSGYLAAAPNHRDARCGTARGRPHGPLRGDESFFKPDRWSSRNYQDRGADMTAVLDAIVHEKSLEGLPVHASRIGVCGHSLGGYTALGLAGGWPSWKDPRYKAVLVLAGYVNPYVMKGNLGRLDVPVMYQGGTLDLGTTPQARRFQGAYDRSAAPKYYVEFDGAGHLAWTDLNAAATHSAARRSELPQGAIGSRHGGREEVTSRRPPRLPPSDLRVRCRPHWESPRRLPGDR